MGEDGFENNSEDKLKSEVLLAAEKHLENGEYLDAIRDFNHLLLLGEIFEGFFGLFRAYAAIFFTQDHFPCFMAAGDLALMFGDDEQHKVMLTKNFHIGRYPVTQRQWVAVMGNNPSDFKGDDLPVETVSWDDVQAYIRKLNERIGENRYCLPTEAEWEYACRAGSTGEYCFGDGEVQLDEYAWYENNSGGKTHPVGQKKPNDWGLYDMHGNVCEWVSDRYGDYPSGTVTDPKGPTSGDSRVLRGGSCCSSAMYLRVSDRDDDDPGTRGNNGGFRLAKNH